MKWADKPWNVEDGLVVVLLNRAGYRVKVEMGHRNMTGKLVNLNFLLQVGMANILQTSCKGNLAYKYIDNRTVCISLLHHRASSCHIYAAIH
jgi:hypothetical protein